jgi:hypothetical protein
MRSRRNARRATFAGMAVGAMALALTTPIDAAGPDEIVGFGPLQFGMSIADALRAAPRAHLVRCDFPNQFKSCVDYDDKVYTLPATVRGRFSPDQKLDAVYVQFDQLTGASGSQACRKTAIALLGRLRDDYGPPWQAKLSAAAEANMAANSGAKATVTKPGVKPAPAKKSAPANDAKSAAPKLARQDVAVWFPAKSGKIGLVDVCSGDDTGVVYIVYTPSSVPGRKAS